MSPAIMGALFCIYSGLHLFIYLSNGECALQWPSSQTVKALSALVLPACDFRVEKHKLIMQNSPQKGSKCSNLCLIHSLFYSLFLWGWLRTWLLKIRKHSLSCSLSTRNEGNPLLQIEVEPTSDVSFQLIPSLPFLFVYNGASTPGPDTWTRISI